MAITNADNRSESNRHKHQQNLHRHQTMDDAAVSEVDNLKSLNARLLKETVEKRQQVDSLVQSNRHLESEINRSVMENDSLQSEMNSLTEMAAILEVEKGIVFVFLTVQVNQVAEKMVRSLQDDLTRILVEKSEIERLKSEKESEIGDLNRRLSELLIEIDEQRGVSARVNLERDEIRALLDARIVEVNELIMKVTKAEENETRVLTEVAELKADYDRLMAENTASLSRIESIIKEKDDLQTKLVESNSAADELQINFAKLLEQKKAIADEKTVQDNKNSELQVSVDELKNLVQSLQIEEKALLEKYADLEKKYTASLDNEMEMKTKINELVEEKKETERRIEHLANEKSAVTNNLQDAMNELQQQKLAFDQITEQKTELENAKIHVESEIAKKDEHLNAFKSVISSLEQSSSKQTEKVKELEVESGSYKSSFDQATVEKDEVIKQLNDQKTITDGLNETITVMQKEIEDLNEELASLTADNEKHLGEKNRLTDQCAGLVTEVADLEARFTENRVEFEGKLSAAEANSNRVLNILKKTVMVCDGTSDFDQENGVEEGIKEHVAGIVAIKKVLMDKESRLEEMKMQVELVKSCAKKEKGFWTMVSSATTLLAAAASLAYVARAH